MTTRLCQLVVSTPVFCHARLLGLGLGLLLLVCAPARGEAGAVPDIMGFRQRLDEFVRKQPSDPLARSLAEEIVRRGESYLAAPRLKHQTDHPAMLDTARAAMGRVFAWAASWRLTGDRRYLEAARGELRNVASFPEWGPNHFLGVAEMSLAVSVGYACFYAELSAGDRAFLREALLAKVLAHAPDNYAPAPAAEGKLWRAFGSTDTATNNWNQVCNGGLLAAALVLEPERPELTRLVVDGVKRSLPRAMQMYAPDGAWPEGPVYWSYATTYTVLNLALLEARYGSDSGLAELPGFAHTTDFMLHAFGPSRRAFNFGDGGAMDSDRPGLQAPAFWLGRRFGQGFVLEQARQRLALGLAGAGRTPPRGIPGGEERFLVLNALWFPFAGAGAPAATWEVLPLDRHFRGIAELAVFRSAWNDPEAWCVALKAGTNGFAHGHLDLGSFMLEAEGIRWAVDLGGDNYRLPGYWEDEEGGRRWSYFRTNNRSHATLTIGDGLQAAQAKAPITVFRSDPRFACAITDLSQAYPGVGGKIVRGVAMIDRKQVLVADELRGVNPAAEVSWRMVTDADVSLSANGRVAILKKRGKQIHARLLEPATGRFMIGQATPPTPEENQNANIRLLRVDALPAGGNLNVAVMFVPGLPPGQDKLAFPAVPPLDQW